ncbi:MAG: outer membrane lipoprotein-sorting protein [Candidatus Aureabacteria bacterium]|nr:outer membrane lipoprotein-sorting protein [Candidatus Auribacterota bacterium]
MESILSGMKHHDESILSFVCRIRLFIAVIGWLVLYHGLLFARDIGELLNQLQNNMEITTDVRALVLLTQQKAEQGTKVIGMEYYRRDRDDSFLIVMTAPESDKGNGYLRVGDNFWMYRKNTRTFQHINRDESIGGSDAKADDFEKRKLTELYEGAKDISGCEILSETLLGKIPVYRFEVKAKVNDVDYPKKIYWIRRDNYLPLKEQSYSLSGTLMQTAYFRKYTMVKDKYVPIEQLFIDEFEKGNKTLVEISGISIEKLQDSIFTKAYLENLSK